MLRTESGTSLPLTIAPSQLDGVPNIEMTQALIGTENRSDKGEKTGYLLDDY